MRNILKSLQADDTHAADRWLCAIDSSVRIKNLLEVQVAAIPSMIRPSGQVEVPPSNCLSALVIGVSCNPSSRSMTSPAMLQTRKVLQVINGEIFSPNPSKQDVWLQG